MKSTIFFIVQFSLLQVAISFAQEDLTSHIAQARGSYNSGDLENTRYELENAMIALDKLISQKILDEMPNEWGGLIAKTQDDIFSGQHLGFAGLFVNRSYLMEKGSSEKSIAVQLISDSPMLSAMNAFLNNPIVAGMSGRKRIKVDGYKGVIERTSDTGENEQYKVSVPFGNALLEFDFYNMGSEAEVTGLINLFPVAEVIALSK